MSKSKQLVVISIITVLILTFAIIISCEKNGTDSSVIFDSGTYFGTYSIKKVVDMNVVTLIDTMSFRFASGNGVYIKLATEEYPGQHRDFNDVTGTYEVAGNRLEIIVDLSDDGGGYIYRDGKNDDEIPEDKYIFYGRAGEIVFDGLDNKDQNIDRQIILWLPVE